MKMTMFLIANVVGISMMGLTNNFYACTAIAAEEKVIPHENVTEPTQVLMNDIADQMDDILDGILAGSFKYVAQEAGAIVDKSYTISKTFFPVEAKENVWFKRAKIDPNDKERIAKLREEFDGYLKEIVSSALEIQKAAKTNNQKATFKAFTDMIEKTCFECHEKIRDKMIPIENR
ncbi:MAG: cytochrome c [Candidatus Brocadia sp.]|nr:cytochrome c [Candidatus Brocadia sp.]